MTTLEEKQAEWEKAETHVFWRDEYTRNVPYLFVLKEPANALIAAQQTEIERLREQLRLCNIDQVNAEAEAQRERERAEKAEKEVFVFEDFERRVAERKGQFFCQSIWDDLQEEERKALAAPTPEQAGEGEKG